MVAVIATGACDQLERVGMNVFFKVVVKLGLPTMLAFTSVAFAADGALLNAPELLDAESAFQVTAKMKDANTIELNYTIADGYYMYRKRFKFGADSDAAVLKKAILPKGSVMQDATFGRAETYRRTVRVLLPLAASAAGRGKTTDLIVDGGLVELSAISQGCADVGVCYPPLTHQLAIQLGSRETVSPVRFVRPDGVNDLIGNTLLPKMLPAASILRPTGSVSDLIRKSP